VVDYKGKVDGDGPRRQRSKEREGKDRNMAKVQTDILSFVQKYVDENDRGCPKGVLLHVGGFKAKDITAALETGALESSRGSEGGLFPKGAKPVPQARVNVTLKSRMVDALTAIASGDTVSPEYAKSLVAEYDAECARRSVAQKE
jgi:hypothetical protein